MPINSIRRRPFLHPVPGKVFHREIPSKLDDVSSCLKHQPIHGQGLGSSGNAPDAGCYRVAVQSGPWLDLYTSLSYWQGFLCKRTRSTTFVDGLVINRRSSTINYFWTVDS